MEEHFGIDAIAVSIPRHYIALKTLAEARGVDPAKYHEGLGVKKMAVVAPEEDPVTMATEAARRLLLNYDVDRGAIGMVIVGSESGVDAAKPIASYVHGLLGLPSHCRTFDTKHACYGATAGLRLAANWCAHEAGRKALVIATDIARYELESPGEPTQGAGAVAMLVSSEPRLVAFDAHPDAVFTEDVMDFWRPNYSTTAMVDGKYSLQCYLKAAENTYEAYTRLTGVRWEDFSYLLFHVPFPKMAYKGFTRLYEMEAKKRPLPPLNEEFDRLTRPALWANVEVGNIYSGSLYLSLAALLEGEAERVASKRIGLFSYGSGSCAEFFSGRVGPQAYLWRDRTGVAWALENRVEIDYDTYVRMRQESEAMGRDGSFRVPRGPLNGDVMFLGVRDHRRIYHSPQRAAMVA